MKTTFVKILCALFGVLMLSACAKDEEVLTGNIIGKVTDANTGAVLQGVTVTISPSGVSRTTGSDGYFEFRDLEPNQYEIQARKNGYTTNNKMVTVVTGRDASGDIQLTPVVQSGKVALSVNSLNFGSQNSSLSFSIQNNGNKSVNWNISGLDKINWLTMNPTTGTLSAGKSNAVTVTLNRERITEYKEAVIIVNADNESLSLKITAEAEYKSSKISLSANTLNFGTDYSSLTFDVKNVGNAGDVNWSITGVDVDWIKVTPTEGVVAMNKSCAVKVDVDRDKLAVGKHSTTVLVNADGESFRVTINAEKGSGRYLEVSPSALALGTSSTAALSIMSHNGPTMYELYGEGEFGWASFDKVEGVISEYNSADASTIETLNLVVDRTGLPAGDYNFTLIINSDLGDYKVPVTMTVEEGQVSAGNEMVVPEGLYTYYKFEDNFDDSSENMIHGFGMNAPTFVEGVTPESKAVKFNRTNKSSFVLSEPIIDSEEMTISFWGKDFSDGNIFYVLSSDDSKNHVFTLTMSGGQLKFIVGGYHNEYSYDETGTFMHPTLTDGKWHHIVLVSDYSSTTLYKNTTILYVDGQAVDVISESTSVSSDYVYGKGLKFVMGGDLQMYVHKLNGTNMSVDNFRVYDTRRLTADEIKSIYNAKQ